MKRKEKRRNKKNKNKKRKEKEEKRNNVEGGKVHEVSFPRMEERLLLRKPSFSILSNSFSVLNLNKTKQRGDKKKSVYDTSRIANLKSFP